jgi:transposase-like protein
MPAVLKFRLSTGTAVNIAPRLRLSVKERMILQIGLSSPGTPRALRLRTRAILGCAEGKTNLVIGRELGVTNLTVGKWRRQFLNNRLRGFEREARGRRVAQVILSSEERAVLENRVVSPQSSALVASRAQAILACAAGKSNIAVARETGMSEMTVGKLRRRFLLKRLEGLESDQAGRPLAPLTLSFDERVTLEAWSRALGLSPAVVQRSKLILACAKGQSNIAAALEAGLSEQAVGHFRQRFVERRLEAFKHWFHISNRATHEKQDMLNTYFSPGRPSIPKAT